MAAQSSASLYNLHVAMGTSQDKRIAELEAEIEQLKARLLMKSQTMMTVGGVRRSSLPPSNFTVYGLEECVLLVDEDDVIRFANSEIARLVGCDDKHKLLRRPLSECDSGPLGSGFLQALVQSTRASQQTNVLERSFPDLSLSTTEPGMQDETTIRFIAHNVEGKVQVVAQDVTKLRWLERTFSRHVSPEVVQQLMTISPEALMTVERKVLTVLFTDLREFAAVCENMAADDICSMLNEHFECIVAPVEGCAGTVMKFTGDGMLAIFGAPLQLRDHTVRALKAAIEMQALHTNWMRQRQENGKVATELGVGIAVGEVVAGNVGTTERMEYTVHGHIVNLASRLCASAKGGEILTERGTYDAVQKQYREVAEAVELPRVSFESVKKMHLRNVSRSIDVIRVTVGSEQAMQAQG